MKFFAGIFQQVILLGKASPWQSLESVEKMKELMMTTLQPHITGVSCVDIALEGVKFLTKLLTKSSQELLYVGENLVPVRKTFSEWFKYFHFFTNCDYWQGCGTCQISVKPKTKTQPNCDTGGASLLDFAAAVCEKDTSDRPTGAVGKSVPVKHLRTDDSPPPTHRFTNKSSRGGSSDSLPPRMGAPHIPSVNKRHPRSSQKSGHPVKKQYTKYLGD